MCVCVFLVFFSIQARACIAGHNQCFLVTVHTNTPDDSAHVPKKTSQKLLPITFSLLIYTCSYITTTDINRIIDFRCFVSLKNAQGSAISINFTLFNKFYPVLECYLKLCLLVFVDLMAYVITW